MRLIGKLLRLSQIERRLLIQSSLLLWAIRAGLALFPLQRVRRLLARLSGERGQAPIRQIAWAVDAASRYGSPSTCLTRALAMKALLVRHGHPATLRIGVAKEAGGTLEAHAWVESGGVVVLGQVEELASYTPLPPLQMDGP